MKNPNIKMRLSNHDFDTDNKGHLPENIYSIKIH